MVQITFLVHAACVQLLLLRRKPGGQHGVVLQELGTFCGTLLNWWHISFQRIRAFLLLLQNFIKPLLTYHRFISFSLYVIGFIWFVLSLVKKYYLRQFSLVSDGLPGGNIILTVMFFVSVCLDACHASDCGHPVVLDHSEHV